MSFVPFIFFSDIDDEGTAGIVPRLNLFRLHIVNLVRGQNSHTRLTRS